MAKADPNDAQAKRDLSVSYNKLGDVHLKLGATDKALKPTRRLELSEAGQSRPERRSGEA